MIERYTMEPGFYVVRMPARGTGLRLMIESRPICIPEDEVWNELPRSRQTAREYARDTAERWRDFIQSQHPKDDVFVIEREHERT